MLIEAHRQDAKTPRRERAPRNQREIERERMREKCEPTRGSWRRICRSANSDLATLVAWRLGGSH